MASTYTLRSVGETTSYRSSSLRLWARQGRRARVRNVLRLWPSLILLLHYVSWSTDTRLILLLNPIAYMQCISMPCRYAMYRDLRAISDLCRLPPFHPSTLLPFYPSTLPPFYPSTLPPFQPSTLPPFHPSPFHPSTLPPFHPRHPTHLSPIHPPSGFSVNCAWGAEGHGDAESEALWDRLLMPIALESQ
jgi:hypothetical protein